MINGNEACVEIHEPFLSCEYEGGKDKDNRKSGFGTHIWISTRITLKYEGDFFQNTLHGFGDLLLEKQFHYTGHFFANCYEGFGRLKYFNGNIFEGLFMDNKKFGPGVFTYTCGSQDVGYWIGGSLIRLCCNSYLDLVPQITRSFGGNKYIQKFKKIVRFQYPSLDKAKEKLRELNIDENNSVMERKDELYNRFLGQRYSAAFNNNKFEEMYFSSKICDDDLKTVESTSLSAESEESGEEYCPVNSLFTKEILLQEITDQIAFVDVLVYYLQLQKRNLDQVSTQNSYESHEEDEYIEDFNSDNGDYNEYVLEKMEEEHPWLKDSLENIEIIFEGSGLSSFQKKHFKLFEENADVNLEMIKLLFLRAEKLKTYLTNKYEKLVTERNIKRRRAGTTNEKTLEGLHSVVEVQPWNNNQWAIDMAAHCYYHKQKEDTLSFNISDFNNRLKFSVCGPHECDCLCFLLRCAFGDSTDVVDLCKRHVNPNVSNCRGNSGVFFAVTFDNIKILKTLRQLGADLDVYNDECLTPLTLAFCRLLTLLYNVTDWEKAFLPSSGSTASSKQHETLKDTHELHHSEIEITENSNFVLPSSVVNKILDSKQLFNYKSVGHQEFILSTECIKVPLEKKKKTEKKRKGKKGKEDKKGTKKGKEKNSKKGKREKDSKKGKGEKNSRNDKKGKEKKKSMTPEKKEEVENLEETEKLLKIGYAKDTIWSLLELGADPDFGNVPLPPLILSVFVKCEPLIKELLKKGNPDITTFIDNLSAIHVLCCLSFNEDYLKMLEAFVSATNLNLRTGTEHWKKEKELILSTEPSSTVLDEGKTALHILSMRYDFEGFENIQWNMFELLAYGGADPELTYLGHTPLTLAMLRGNIFLIEKMLKCRLVNPNQILGEGMGVPLTVLLLKRYRDYLPDNICMRLVNLLMNYNGNPFVLFSIYGNSVEFLEKEYESSVTKTKESKRNKSKSKEAKGKDKKKKGGYKALIHLFLIFSRNFLLRHIQAKVVEYLYYFMSEECSEEKYLYYMAKFVNVDEAAQCLQLLIQNRIIVPHENTLNFCRDVLNFITMSNMDSSRRDNRVPGASVKQSTVETILSDFSMEKNVYVDDKYNSYPPELDKNVDKYVVCYQCCKSVGKELIPCPMCWMVYFCSEACNKNSLQAGIKHKCKLLFYANEKMRLEKIESQTSPRYTPLQEKFLWIKEQIRKRKFKKMLEERFAKEWDVIYGIRRTLRNKLEFNSAKMKFVGDKLCAFYKNNPEAPTECI